MKTLWKKASFKVWSIVSVFLIIVLVIVSVLCNTTFSNLLNFALGGPTNVYQEGQESAYSATFNSKTESLSNADKVNLSLCEEGMVLLKNDNKALPIQTPKSPNPSKNSPKISVFGKNSVNIAYGGSGSGAASGNNSVSVYDSLQKAGFDVNQTLKGFYQNDSVSGPARAGNSSDLDSGDTVVISTAETPMSSYSQSVIDSYGEYSDAAIVIFTRVGGEGFDLPRTMKGAVGYRNENDHYLQLDQNETDLLKDVCSRSFGHVIVVINSGSPMELGFLEKSDYYAYQSKIDAAIWMGYPGNSGSEALGEILNGSVNPSGRTVDTFSTDFKKDPTWNNFGDNRVTGNFSSGVQGGDEYSLDGKLTLYYFVDYEEGIYVGYKYYETRGEEEGENWYQENVVYPFGYGLSYTDFDWSVENKDTLTTLQKGQQQDIKVKVTNTGDVSGKDVVELYCSVPYSMGGIAKPSEFLVGYAKTGVIEPKQSETVTISFDPYSCASYDYDDANHNGFKGYELEKGTYCLRVAHDAHHVEDTIPLVHAEDERYDVDPTTRNTVTNRYTDQSDPLLDSDTQLSTILSRDNWDGTWPDSPNDGDKTATQKLIDAFKDTKTNNPHDYDNEQAYPLTEEKNGLKLRDLLYDSTGAFTGKVAYDDSRWDTLLDQMSVGEASYMYDYASYQIQKVDSIGLPYMICADGPVGWRSFVNKTTFENTCSYCCGVIVASTWNQDLVEKFGEAVGEEGLVGKDGTPYTGWYAPGVNIHRSPFGGRCFEYFSEDGFLAGKTAAAEIRGCQSKGVVPFVKHFALNEQETHRSITGDATWVNEQAMREIYLKPFEIAVKEGHSRGIMSSFNRIGTRWTGGDYRLLTSILREEWGFQGAVICDFNTIPAYMDSRQMAFAGGDLNLATLPVSFVDESSTADVYVLRNALKHVAYSAVNSNAMKGDVIGQKLAGWQVLVIGVDVGIGGMLFLWGGFVIIRILRKTKKKDSSSFKA